MLSFLESGIREIEYLKRHIGDNLVEELKDRLENMGWGQEPELRLLEIIYGIEIRVCQNNNRTIWWRNGDINPLSSNVITLFNQNDIHYQSMFYEPNKCEDDELSDTSVD